MTDINTVRMEKMTLRDLLRGTVTKRWHTVPTTSEQNLAEHSHQVGIIAEAILKDFYMRQYGSTPPFEALYISLKYAQLHDLPEVVLGDIPSPAKAAYKAMIPGFDAALKKMEHQLIPELGVLEEAMKQYPYLPIFLKCADIIEAKLFFTYARGRDECQTRIVMEKLEAELATVTDKLQRTPDVFTNASNAIQSVYAEVFADASELLRAETQYART